MKMLRNLGLVLLTIFGMGMFLSTPGSAHVGVQTRQNCFLKDLVTGEWRGGDRNYWIEQNPYMDVTFWTLDLAHSLPFPKMKFALEYVRDGVGLLEGQAFFRGDTFAVEMQRTGDGESRLTLTYSDHQEVYQCEVEPEDHRP